MSIDISVIVPVYNTERYLEKCLKTILSQDLCGCTVEVILINDGSTDNSAKICDQYATNFDVVRAIHQNNSGASATRNVGIQEAKGKYICFID
ncbi:MAG: glycosyltransferase, partial [Culicoidibacterales bacterium]